MEKVINNGLIEGIPTKRKLNFFFLLDISGSMAGKKIQTLNWAVKEVIPALENIENTERIEILMHIITFSSTAKWHIGPQPVPLKDFFKYWNDLTTDSFTATDEAIELLADALDIQNIGRRNVPPVCILISDGYCTSPQEKYDNAIDRLNSIPWGKKAVRLSIGIGQDGEDYCKEELDKFISPYLRVENGVETLEADNPKKLANYIITASCQASISSSKSRASINGNQPVVLNMDDLNEDSDFSLDIDDVDEVF